MRGLLCARHYTTILCKRFFSSLEDSKLLRNVKKTRSVHEMKIQITQDTDAIPIRERKRGVDPC